MDLKIRDIIESDRAFVCDAYWRSSKQTKSMAEIKQIVSDNLCKLAVLDDDTTILSFIIFTHGQEILFKYTKQAFRGMGINKRIQNEI